MTNTSEINMNAVTIPFSDSPYLAKVGRADNFINALMRSGNDVYDGLYPASCTVFKYNNENFQNKPEALIESLVFSSRALRKAAGVKIQLEGFKKSLPLQGIKWFWTIHPGHPDALRMKYLAKHYQNTFYEDMWKPSTDEDYIDPEVFEIIKVADSMEESDTAQGLVSIEKSWEVFTAALYAGKIPVVDLSRLRPYGDVNEKGLKATGVFGDLDEYQNEKDNGSFLSLYWRIFNHVKKGDIQTLLQLFGQVNRTINRGGLVKSGIICTALHYAHPDIKAYLNTPLMGLIGSQKKGIRIDEEILLDAELCRLVCRKVNEESLFLEKIQPLDSDGEELFNNVCEEILLRHRGTCLLSHVNAGMISEPSEIPTAMCEVMKFLCELHITWRSKVKGWEKLYIPLSQDKQVGLGWVGFANMLAIMGVRYIDHVDALEYVLQTIKEYKGLKGHLKQELTSMGKAYEIAWYLYQGYQDSAVIAREYGLDRAFTMAPTQTVAFKYTDSKGHTLARAIDPPLHKMVKRPSDRIDTMWVSYGRKIETCIDVGSQLHTRQWDAWQGLMNTTGLAHSMSFDLWQKVDTRWLAWFLMESNLKTTYYQFADVIEQDYLDKGRLPEVFSGTKEPEAKAACTPDFCPVCAE